MLHKSDLSWIPLSERKNINMPSVVYEPKAGQNYGGYYTLGSSTLVIVDGENNAAAIAHEFRHHQQFEKGELNSINDSNLGLFHEFSYNKAIRLYFRTQWHEMDALQFEYRVAKSKINKFWMEALVVPTEFDEYLER